MGRSRQATIKVPKEFAQWIAGFEQLGEQAQEVGLLHWRVATDIFFDRTQQFVHVLTSNLKSSGRSSVRVSNGRVTGTLRYGGANVRYAIIEEERGGDHAYLSRGWEASQATFQKTMGQVFEATARKVWD